jgi:hypothetical protein
MPKLSINKELEGIIDCRKTYSIDSVITLAELFGINTKKRIFRHDFSSNKVMYLGSYVQNCFLSYFEGLVSFKDAFNYVKNTFKNYDNAKITRGSFLHMVALYRIDSFKYSSRRKEGYKLSDFTKLFEGEAILKISSFHKENHSLLSNYTLRQVRYFIRKLQIVNVIPTPKGHLGSRIFVKDMSKIVNLINKDL